MAKVGTRIEENGILVREGGQLLVRRELGGRWAIDFDPAVDLEIGMPGRIVGTIVAKGVLALERFTPDV